MCQEMVKQSKQKTIQERAQELQNVFAQDYQRYADKQMQPFNTMIARDLTEAGQTGANCGCYAAGMAIESLLNSYRKKMEMNGPESIASDFEIEARKQHMSSIGEMFSAETLTEALNLFAQNNNIGADKKIKAVSAEFKTQRKLETIISEATARGIRVLIAYYSGDDLMPIVPKQSNSDIDETGRVLPTYMANAHWAVVNTISKEDDKLKVDLFEGHKMINGHSIKMNTLYNSNLSLGDLFDWTGFLDNEKRDAQMELNETIRREMVKQIEEETEAVAMRKQDKKEFFMESEKIMEKVSLRGKVVLIGVEK